MTRRPEMVLWLLLAVSVASNFYFWHAGKFAGAEAMRESMLRHPVIRARKESNRLDESA
jgi:hypothetical protein